MFCRICLLYRQARAALVSPLTPCLADLWRGGGVSSSSKAFTGCCVYSPRTHQTANTEQCLPSAILSGARTAPSFRSTAAGVEWGVSYSTSTAHHPNEIWGWYRQHATKKSFARDTFLMFFLPAVSRFTRTLGDLRISCTVLLQKHRFGVTRHGFLSL